MFPIKVVDSCFMYVSHHIKSFHMHFKMTHHTVVEDFAQVRTSRMKCVLKWANMTSPG